MKKSIATIKTKPAASAPRLPSFAHCATKHIGSGASASWECLVEPASFQSTCSFALELGATFHCMCPRRNHYARVKK